MSKDEEDDQNANIGVGRYPCMPSLVALQQMRNRLHLAYLGKKLMKWTALATGRELRKIAGDLNASYEDFAEELANCYILLARCRYYYPSLNGMVIEDIQKEASISLTTTVKAISAGVKCVSFEIIESESPPYPHMGIEKGGQTIKETKIAWANLLKKMILILQLRNHFSALDNANRAATKKSNVLDKVIIPKTLATIKYILLELEELSREELYRIKKVVQNKKKKAAKMQQKPPAPIKTLLPLPPKPAPILIRPTDPGIVCVKVCKPPSDIESDDDIIIPPPTCTSSVCRTSCQGSTSAYGKPRSLEKIIIQLDSEKTRHEQRAPVVCQSLQNALRRSMSRALDLQLRQTKSEQRIFSGGRKRDIQMLRGLCQEVKSEIMELFPAQKEGFKERLMRLKNGINIMKSTCCDLQSRIKESPNLNELVKKSSQVRKRIDSLMGRYRTEEKIAPDSACRSVRSESESSRTCQDSSCSQGTARSPTVGSRPTLNDLRHSIDDTMKLVNKVKREGLLDDSMTNLMKTLSSTRRAIAREKNFKQSSNYVEPACLCDLCVCTAEEYYDKFHNYIRSTKRQPSVMSIKSACTNNSSISRAESHGILASTPPTASNRNVRIKEDGDVKIFEDKIKKISKVKTTVNDDGTISEVKEVITVKMKPDNESASIASSESTKTEKDMKDMKSSKDTVSKPSSKTVKKDPPGKNNDQNIAFCSASFNSFGFLLPIRKAKSETVFVVQPITTPCLRHCISLTVNKHPDLDLTYESSHSFVENLHVYSEICN